MDNQDQPLDAGLNANDEQASGLTITDSIRQYWSECAKWGLFFAVLGFIYIGFLVIATFTMASAGSAGLVGGIFTLIIAGGLIFVPTWLMFQFSQNLKKGLEEESTPAASLGFRNLRRLYQFAGILMIILLAIYALVFLLGLIFSVGSSL
jgi:hypothetical protein